MSLVGAAVAGGLISAGGSAISGITSAIQARKNREAQQRENEITRSREDSAYQRAVADARAAGLSPLVVSGTSGASSQSLTAPQMETDIAGRAISSGSQVFQDILSSRSVDGQLALNNAQVGKLIEETRGQSISNAYASADYQARILKLLEEADNIKTNTAREKVFLEGYRNRLQEDLKGQQLANSGKSIANKAAQGTVDFNEEQNLPLGTTYSGSTGGSIVDAARLTGRDVAKAAQTLSANAKAADEQLRQDYKSYSVSAEKQYQIYVKEWKRKCKSALERAKKTNSQEDMQYYRSLMKNHPRRSDYVLSYEEYKKQRMSK